MSCNYYGILDQQTKLIMYLMVNTCTIIIVYLLTEWPLSQIMLCLDIYPCISDSLIVTLHIPSDYPAT